ncbi:MAG: tRNA lysidine(34) synthetase TilS [Anaerolineae bacterium]
MLLNVLHTIRKHNLIPAGSTVLVGVSGGADSLALLHVLRSLQAELACHLHVATLDHGLRGDASAQDVNFVVKICEQWGIPVTADKVDVAALAQQSRRGIEAEARRARYLFYSGVVQQLMAEPQPKADHVVVALAHHANDQAETLLMRLVRGTGTHGLQGIAPKMLYHEGVVPFTVVRPLLGITRSQIETYCQEQRLQPRHDATNDDTDYTRNYLRHEILPRLETINPQVVSALNRLGETAAVEEDFLTEMFQEFVLRQAVVKDGWVRYPRERFTTLHPYLQRRFVRWAAGQLGRSEDLSYERILAAVDIGLSGQVGSVAELPNRIQLRVDYVYVVIEAKDALPQAVDVLRMDAGSELPVSIPGRVEIPNYRWSLTTSLESDTYQARVAVPEGANVILRTRRTGERFAPLGLNGHTQKLSEWMVDHKIPRAVRDYVPLLVVDGQIAAILYGTQWIISHYFAVHHGANRVIYLEKH